MGAERGKTDERIALICEGVRAWLDNEDGILNISVDRTATEGLFPRHDVMFMLGSIAESLSPDALHGWVSRVTGGESSVTNETAGPGATGPDGRARNPNVLCLHAGNLPLVGFQDIIAALLSGCVYYGKLSKKDPWLPDGLLRVLRKRLPAQLGGWTVRLEDLDKAGTDRVLFAGADTSVPKVQRRIRELGLASPDARFLPRTARYSMAWISEDDFLADETRLSKHLIDAMLRYEGRGCRSLAVVVAERSLGEFAGSLGDAAEVFTRQNPPSHLRKPGVNYWRSYLKSTGKEVFDLGGQIITDDPELIGREDIICWLKGTRADAVRLARQAGPHLQQVYRYTGRDSLSSQAGNALSDDVDMRFEPLSRAQRPLIDWQPDGIDVLAWLWQD
jgi:hypothetical protein